MCTFTIVSTRRHKQGRRVEREISRFSIETWGNLADRCKRLYSGQKVRVVGRLKEDRWTGVDGKAHSKMAIVAEHVEFMKMCRNGDLEDRTTKDEGGME